mgnify:CR=1 FL=1
MRGVACLWGALGLAGLALPAVADPAAGVNALRAAAGLPALARAPRLEVAAAPQVASSESYAQGQAPVASAPATPQVAAGQAPAGLTQEQLEARDDKKGQVWFAVIRRKGRPAAEVIALFMG